MTTSPSPSLGTSGPRRRCTPNPARAALGLDSTLVLALALALALTLTPTLTLTLTLTLMQVAEHVRARFCTDEWRDAHLGKTVNEIIVTYASTGEVHGSRPQPGHEYACAPQRMCFPCTVLPALQHLHKVGTHTPSSPHLTYAVTPRWLG